MEIKASSFKLRANAPKGQKRFPISHAPLLSLPGLLGANLDAPPPSIFPAHNSAASLQRIGFACAGNPNHPDDAARSLSLELFKPLFGNRFEWLCLQKNLRPSEALPPGIPHPGGK